MQDENDDGLGDRFIAKNEHMQLITSIASIFTHAGEVSKEAKKVCIWTNLFTKANRFGAKHPPCEKDRHKKISQESLQ
jgi:hypothetical protein